MTVLDPAAGRELRKTRPCVIISPAALHDFLPTCIVAPMTTDSRPAPYRVPVAFDGRKGFILLDQIRTLDQLRLLKRLGKVNSKTIGATLATLQELFAP